MCLCWIVAETGAADFLFLSFFFHIEGGLKINMQVYYSNLPKIAQDVGFIHAFNLS